jgi:outer membrane protein OmpA-like peptidoglycan-associated protein/Tfp pilus assembly protein PilF
MIIKKLSIWLVLFFAAMATHAQPQTYTTTNKSAIKLYEQATKYYDSRHNTKAIEMLRDALNKDAQFIEAHMLLADVYVDDNKFNEAIISYKNAVAINPNFFPNNWYRLAQIELNQERYAEAKSDFQKFLTYKNTNVALQKKAAAAIINCDFAIKAMLAPLPIVPLNLGEAINTTADEYYPSLTIDNKTLVFTRNTINESSRIPQEDFYLAHQKNNQWQKSQPAGSPLNTSLNEGAPSISADGKLLFFAACGREDGKGSCDIYFSRLVNDQWSAPKNLGEPINTNAWETQPSFSSDGKTLYFIRGYHTHEGIKQQDIYVTSIGKTGNFERPVKLTDSINTSEAEESVFIHPDNQTLYFSSRGHVGMGGLDIFISRKNKDGQWGQAKNLGYPINTSGDENSLLISPQGDKAYFATNRQGGLGGLDLYSFELPQFLKPQPITYVKCAITDAANAAPLAASFEIIDISTQEIIYADNVNKSGTFIRSLTAGKDYLLNVSHNGYLFYSDNFSCKTSVDYSKPFEINIALQKAVSGSKVVLKNIFFETDSATLNQMSFAELKKLQSFMQQNADVQLRITGHTDNSGNALKNQRLSENRAQAVYQYLINAGIDAKRLQHKGMGDKQPIANNQTPEGRALNRRTEAEIF